MGKSNNSNLNYSNHNFGNYKSVNSVPSEQRPNVEVVDLNEVRKQQELNGKTTEATKSFLPANKFSSKSDRLSNLLNVPPMSPNDPNVSPVSQFAERSIKQKNRILGLSKHHYPESETSSKFEPDYFESNKHLTF